MATIITIEKRTIQNGSITIPIGAKAEDIVINNTRRRISPITELMTLKSIYI